MSGIPDLDNVDDDDVVGLDDDEGPSNAEKSEKKRLFVESELSSYVEMMEEEEKSDSTGKGTKKKDEEKKKEPPKQPSKPLTLYEKGLLALRKGLFRESFVSFEKAFNEAREKKDIDVFQKAVDDFTKDIESKKLPNEAYGYFFRSMVFSNLEKFSLSLQDLNFAAALEKTDDLVRSEIHFHRGLVRHKLAKLKGAVEDFTLAINLDPRGNNNAVLYRFFVQYKLKNVMGMKLDYDILTKGGFDLAPHFREEVENIAQEYQLETLAVSKESKPKKKVEFPDKDKIEAVAEAEPEKEEEPEKEKKEEEITELADLEKEGLEGLPLNEEEMKILQMSMAGGDDSVVDEELMKMSTREKLKMLKDELATFENMNGEQDQLKFLGYFGTKMKKLTKLMGWFNEAQTKWRVNFEKCRQLVKGQQYVPALQLLNECMEFEEAHVESYYLRAVCYYHLKDYEKAQRDIAVAIQLEPRNHLFYSLLGYVFVNLTQWKNALQCFENALMLVLKMNMEILKNQREQKGEQKPEEQKEMVNDRVVHEYYYICAMVSDQMKQYEKSVAYISKAITFDKDNASYKTFYNMVSEKYQKSTQKEKEPMDEEQELMKRMIEEMKKMEELEKRVEARKKATEEAVARAVEVDEDDNEDSEDEEEDSEEEEKRLKQENEQSLKKAIEKDKDEKKKKKTRGWTNLMKGEGVFDNSEEILDWILKKLNMFHFRNNFERKNVIWYDVLKGYLTDEDYLEVLPKMRFVLRFKSFVQDHLIGDHDHEERHCHSGHCGCEH